jgi:predicted transcriptional regulator
MTTPAIQSANPTPIAMTTEIVTAYVGNNTLPQNDLPNLIQQVYKTVSHADTGTVDASVPESSAESVDRPTRHKIKASIKHDGIISFIDGKPYKTLKRHLAKHGTTPEAYRRTWGLPNDYPMVAESYSQKRSEIARRNMFAGQGKPRDGEMAAVETLAEPAETRRTGRRMARKAEAVSAAPTGPQAGTPSNPSVSSGRGATARGRKNATAETAHAAAPAETGDVKVRRKPGPKPKNAAAQEPAAPTKARRGMKAAGKGSAKKPKTARKAKGHAGQDAAHA